MTDEPNAAATDAPAPPEPLASAPLAPAQVTPATPSPQRPRNPVRRALNWFWRGAELRSLRGSRGEVSGRARELSRRSQLLLELGRRALHPSEPLPHPADAVALELNRQAAYWAARAVAIDQGASEPVGQPWDALDAATTTRAAGSAEELSRLQALVERPFDPSVWEAPKEQRAHDTELFARATQYLLSDLEWRTRARDALWIQRVTRVGLLLLSIAVVAWGIRLFIDRSEQSRDLAYGKPWRSSSLVPGFGCRSPQQDCADSPDFFFHTNEEQSPWVELDLGSRVRFSAVRVVNRRDCCFERAAPLIVEISDDQQSFREVARRGSVFSSWLATFAPREARYVRVRVPARTNMHLAQVRVLR